MQLLVQLLVPGADPAPSSISSPVGQEDQGAGTQRQDCKDSRTAVLATATLVPMPPLLLKKMLLNLFYLLRLHKVFLSQ